MQTKPLHEDFGVRVWGLDLSRPPDGAAVAALTALIDEYSFVCFPDQSMDDASQLALTRALGEPETSHLALGEQGRIAHIGTIGNIADDGTLRGNQHQKTRYQQGNNLWHSDSSFKEVPAYLSIMCAYETPDEGGETLFVSGRAAWDRLPAERQAALEPMIGIHDYTYSRSKVAPVAPGVTATLPPVRQRLVRRNPGNGAQNLFLGSHLREIEGMGYERSRETIDALTEGMVAEEHVYAHPWRPGDVVFWDNRCLLHRGAGYDADRYRRYMRQTRVRGTGSSVNE